MLSWLRAIARYTFIVWGAMKHSLSLWPRAVRRFGNLDAIDTLGSCLGLVALFFESVPIAGMFIFIVMPTTIVSSCMNFWGHLTKCGGIVVQKAKNNLHGWQKVCSANHKAIPFSWENENFVLPCLQKTHPYDIALILSAFFFASRRLRLLRRRPGRLWTRRTEDPLLCRSWGMRRFLE